MALFQRPMYGGHTWVFLQYALGLRRLGADVLLIDSLDPAMVVDSGGNRCALGESLNMQYMTNVLDRFGLASEFAVLYDGGRRSMGRSRAEVVQWLADADLLLNVMGFLDDEEILSAASRRVFLDIDPGFGQMWSNLGLANPFSGHDAFVTVGENVGQADCSIPTCGLEWITTPQPVVLDEWASSGGGQRGAFTSVGSWRGPYGPVEYQGSTYGLRVHEFRKFAELPRLTSEEFEVALDIDPADTSDIRLLERNGWRLIDPREAAGDPWTYRGYIRSSKAEFMVAKNMYVDTNSGWFSDRAICYLASGRPVVAQETGFSGRYPTGEGLLSFTTLEEAVAGVEAITADYERHARAARELAEQYFDSDRVLSALLDRLA